MSKLRDTALAALEIRERAYLQANEPQPEPTP